MEKSYILAHDLGTSSDKACIFDTQGNFIADACFDYPIYYPAEGWAEQAPEDWWNAFKLASKAVMQKAGAAPKDVKAISFSAQGMAVIPVDKNGSLLSSRAMIWMDTRARKEGRHIIEKTGFREHYERTGNGFNINMYPAAKILWIRKNQPDIYKNTYKFIGCKEYLIHKMTGVLSYTDYTEAGLGGFYDIHNRCFDPELLDISQTDIEKLLPPTDVTAVMGGLTKSAAEEMGLKKDTPVVLGSWDNFACTTGGGGRTKGNLVTYLGTAGWLSITHDQPVLSTEGTVNCVYIGQDTYFVLCNSNAACAAYDWVMGNCCAYLKNEENMFAAAERLAGSVSAGSDGLFYLPALYAGNTFFPDSNLCGTFLGITASHTNAHIIRAAMEGVSFDLMLGSEFFRSMGALPKSGNIIGGGSNNRLWMEIMSSMYGIQLSRPVSRRNIGALGAALNAMVGTGIVGSFDVANDIIQTDDTVEPDLKDRETYLELLPVFKNFYYALTDAYAKRSSAMESLREKKANE